MSKCRICLDLIKKSNNSLQCKNCEEFFHVDCLLEDFKSLPSKDLLCPACGNKFKIENLSALLSKLSFNKIITAISEKLYKKYIDEYLIYITRFINLKQYIENPNSIKQFESLFNLLDKFIQNHNEESEKSEDSINNLEICTVFPNKFSFDDKQVECFKQIIDWFKQGIFVYKSSISLTYKDFHLINELYEIMKNQDLYIFISENPDMIKDLNKSRSTGSNLKKLFMKFMKYSTSNKSLQLLPINRCVCGGSIISSENENICNKCYSKFCNKCWKKIESDKHKCNQEDIENIEEILKTTVPCPNCGIRIEKSEGCDEMFCTYCHIGFNWKTRQLITRNFENPHREKWLQNNKSKDHNEISVLQSIISISDSQELELKTNYILNNFPSKMKHIKNLFVSINQVYKSILEENEDNKIQISYSIIDNHFNQTNIDRKLTTFKKSLAYHSEIIDLSYNYLMILTDFVYDMLVPEVQYLTNPVIRKNCDLNLMKNLKKYLKKFDLIYRNYYSGKSLVLNDQLSEAIEMFCEELSSNYDLSVEKKFLSLIGKLRMFCC